MTKPSAFASSMFLTVLLAVGCGGGSAASSGGSSSGSSSDTSSGDTSGGSASSDGNGAGDGDGAASDEFQLSDSTTAGAAHGDHPSEIEATATEAAMRFFVVDPDAGPLTGIVVKLTGPDGHAYYTDETDSTGYAEVLVPAGQRYDLEYLALGHRSHTAHVDVPAGPRQDIRLTLRYRPWHPPPRPPLPPTPDAPAPPPPPPDEEHLVLDGVLFGSDSATLEGESGPRLDRVVEYMSHRPSVRIRIEGHTDSAGNARHNQELSEARANAVRDYLVAHGIDAGRIDTVGYGGSRPVAPNDTEEGRAQNRRIEAIEL